MKLRIVLLVSILCCVMAASASAAPWRVISEHPGTYTDETGMVRGPDGALHLVYLDKVGDNNFGIRYRTLSASGALSGPLPVIAGWNGPTNADVELVDGAPTVIWSGLNTAHDGTPDAGGEQWRATLGTAGFGTPTLHTVSQSSYLDTISTAIGADGVLWSGWNFGVYGRFMHVGFDPAAADTTLQEGCCTNSINLERDAVSGAMFMNYYSTITGQEGYWSQKVSPTVEGAQLVPGNISSYLPRARRLPAAARTTGGVYTAICDSADCASFRVTGQAVGQGLRLKRTGSIEPSPNTLWTAAAPSGRMWLVYATEKGVYVTRSNKTLTAWGPTQQLPLPSGATYVQSTAGDGSLGFLDLFVVTSATVTGDSTTHTTRVLPKLVITPAAKSVTNAINRVIQVRLTDAGNVVPGAKVKFRGKVYTPNRLGYVSLEIPAGTTPRSYPVTGTAVGYVAATGSVKVIKSTR